MDWSPPSTTSYTAMDNPNQTPFIDQSIPTTLTFLPTEDTNDNNPTQTQTQVQVLTQSVTSDSTSCITSSSSSSSVPTSTSIIITSTTASATHLIPFLISRPFLSHTQTNTNSNSIQSSSSSSSQNSNSSNSTKPKLPLSTPVIIGLSILSFIFLVLTICLLLRWLNRRATRKRESILQRGESEARRYNQNEGVLGSKENLNGGDSFGYIFTESGSLESLREGLGLPPIPPLVSQIPRTSQNGGVGGSSSRVRGRQKSNVEDDGGKGRSWITFREPALSPVGSPSRNRKSKTNPQSQSQSQSPIGPKYSTLTKTSTTTKRKPPPLTTTHTHTNSHSHNVSYSSMIGSGQAGIGTGSNLTTTVISKPKAKPQPQPQPQSNPGTRTGVGIGRGRPEISYPSHISFLPLPPGSIPQAKQQHQNQNQYQYQNQTQSRIQGRSMDHTDDEFEEGIDSPNSIPVPIPGKERKEGEGYGDYGNSNGGEGSITPKASVLSQTPTKNNPSPNLHNNKTSITINSDIQGTEPPHSHSHSQQQQQPQLALDLQRSSSIGSLLTPSLKGLLMDRIHPGMREERDRGGMVARDNERRINDEEDGEAAVHPGYGYRSDFEGNTNTKNLMVNSTTAPGMSYNSSRVLSELSSYSQETNLPHPRMTQIPIANGGISRSISMNRTVTGSSRFHDGGREEEEIIFDGYTHAQGTGGGLRESKSDSTIGATFSPILKSRAYGSSPSLSPTPSQYPSPRGYGRSGSDYRTSYAGGGEDELRKSAAYLDSEGRMIRKIGEVMDTTGTSTAGARNGMKVSAIPLPPTSTSPPSGFYGQKRGQPEQQQQMITTPKKAAASTRLASLLQASLLTPDLSTQRASFMTTNNTVDQNQNQNQNSSPDSPGGNGIGGLLTKDYGEEGGMNMSPRSIAVVARRSKARLSFFAHTADKRIPSFVVPSSEPFPVLRSDYIKEEVRRYAGAGGGGGNGTSNGNDINNSNPHSATSKPSLPIITPLNVTRHKRTINDHPQPTLGVTPPPSSGLGTTSTSKEEPYRSATMSMYAYYEEEVRRKSRAAAGRV